MSESICRPPGQPCLGAPCHNQRLNMQVPNFAALHKQTVTDGLCHSYAQAMHPNPKFYKYRWRALWSQSACDDHEILDELLSRAHYLKRLFPNCQVPPRIE